MRAKNEPGELGLGGSIQRRPSTDAAEEKKFFFLLAVSFLSPEHSMAVLRDGAPRKEKFRPTTLMPRSKKI